MKTPFPCVVALALGGSMVGAGPFVSADTPAGGRAEVLVLGVYHMASPGHDIFNMKADDVLAPKRQAEIGR